jgi:uncharacterized membrane protein
VNQTFSERWAGRIAKQSPVNGWIVVVGWIPIMLLNLWQRGSEGRLTYLEAGFLVLFWVSLVVMNVLFDGFQRLLAARDRQIDELKSSLENLTAASRPGGA